MNIRTNYPIQQNSVYFNKNIRNSSPAEPKKSETVQNNQVNFTGLTDVLKPRFLKKVTLNSEVKDFLDYASSVLKINYDTLLEKAKGKTEDQMRFLSAMTDHFNSQNYYKKAGEVEDGNVVLELFERIKNPKSEHINFVHRVNISMTDTKKCFDILEDNPKKIAEVRSMYDKLSSVREKDEIASQIIASPNFERYVKEIDEYIPHINATEEKKGLIASIDRQLSSNTLDIVSTHKEKSITDMLSMLPKTSSLSKSDFSEHFSDEGVSIVNSLRIKLSPTAESIERGDSKGIIKIFNTTTKDNVEFRKDFLENNYYNFGVRENLQENEINELSALFELADKDPHTMKLLKGFNSVKIGLSRAGEYFKLIDAIGAERLGKDIKGIKKVFLKNQYEPTDAIIEYFEKGGSPINRFFGVFKKVFGKKEQPRISTSDIVSISPMSRVMSKPAALPAPVQELPEISIKPAVQKRVYEKPEIKVIPMEKESLLPTGRIETYKKPDIAPASEAEVSSVAPSETTQKPKRSYLTFKPHVAKQPNAKKLVVINDVNGIIKKQLGEKTLSEQSAVYANNATKMRLGLLPEIFASIKETRAAERANGTFKKHKSVNNSEAVDLYRRINGKNKKLVNYMLKKRNADGTRTFSVRDIMDVLSDANRSIIEGKNKSTKLNRFTAKDERAIYENIYEQKVTEYGKLQRNSSKKA